MTAWRVQQSGPQHWAVLRPNPDFRSEDPAHCGSWLIVAERDTEADAYSLAWRYARETPEATPRPGKRVQWGFAAPFIPHGILSAAESWTRPYGRRKF